MRSGRQDWSIAACDDCLVISNTFEEHLEHLRALLQHFQQVGLRAHPAKSIVGGDSMPYLGHIVSAQGMSPDAVKVLWYCSCRSGTQYGSGNKN
jgi:hypothetical protein